MPLLMDVHEYNREYFRNFLRMDDDSFQELLHLVKPYTQRLDTRLQRDIPAEDRLMATLRYLAIGK